MNTTEYFKRTIQAYLEERAMEDELFAAKYDNPDKNIDDCVTYILNWVQKSGCNGFCDDEIYGQAIHYYELRTRMRTNVSARSVRQSWKCSAPSDRRQCLLPISVYSPSVRDYNLCEHFR